MRKEIRSCVVCGNYFETRKSDQLYCSSECRKMADEERRRQRDRNKSMNSNLDECVRRVMEYNKKNGTNLSYGQYMGKFGSKS